MKNSLRDVPILGFPSRKTWEQWLKKNHGRSSGIWMRIDKVNYNHLSLKYQDALDGALCYGWIDGQKQRYDENAWLQKFTPRNSRSIWSKRNRERAQALIRKGIMQEPGRAAIEAAKQNGRWDSAYDSQKNASIPAELRKALNEKPKAKKFFESLNSVNRYAIIYRLRTAKREETRERRLKIFVGMLERGEKIHP